MLLARLVGWLVRWFLLGLLRWLVTWLTRWILTGLGKWPLAGLVGWPQLGLLVVVNVAALGRRNLELIQLVSVPYFEGKEAYAIRLDYEHIVLDPSSHTFSILTEQEEHDCLLNRCYVGNSEQTLLEKSCGIPQFYDQLRIMVCNWYSLNAAHSGIYS